MNSEFEELAEYINQQFGAKPVNIIYDTIDNINHGKTPRLGVCFEFAKEAQIFKDGIGNFDAKKQKAIADKFKDIIKTRLKDSRKGLFEFLQLSGPGKYNTKNTFVYFNAFAPIAQIEANQKISNKDISLLKQQLANNDIWEIMPMFSGATFFVHTDVQLREYEDSPEKKKWADAYFKILEPYDEFGYFKREIFGISLDSKENFDTNYNSNWYYYFK